MQHNGVNGVHTKFTYDVLIVINNFITNADAPTSWRPISKFAVRILYEQLKLTACNTD